MKWLAIVALYSIVLCSAHMNDDHVASSPTGNIMDDLNHYELTTPRHIHMDTMSVADVPTNQRDTSKVFEVTAFGQTYRIVAQRTNMFAAGYKEILMSSRGDIIESKAGADVQTDCWYNGRVMGDDASFVTLSTCTHQQATPYASASAGFKVNSMASDNNAAAAEPLSLYAFISAFGKQVFIESAAPHADRVQSYEAGAHIAYRVQDMKKQDSGCGVTDDVVHAHVHAHEPSFTRVSPSSSSSSPSPKATAEGTFVPQPPADSNILGGAHHQLNDKMNNGAARRLLTTYNGNYQKYVELLVFNDYKRWQQRDTDAPSLTKSIVNQVHTLYNNGWAKHFKYGIEIRLVAMISFSNGDPYAAPTPTTSGTEVDYADLLNKFSQFVYTNYSRLPAHDEAHLYSGYDFTGGTVGYAGIGAMCGNSETIRSTGITQANAGNNNALITGATSAHEIGHNFGMQHDDIAWGNWNPPIPSLAFQNQWCNNSTASRLTHVMSSVSDGSTIPTVWSNCSQLYIDYWMDGGSPQRYGGTYAPMCLENVPNRTWTESTAVCGDGIIQSGEQCDCGIASCDLVDPCCVQATCLLKVNASCSPFASDCCDKTTCKPATDSRICRASTNADCDTAETCDGVSASCPTDTVATTGTSCSWGNAFQTGKCYLGDCYSHTRQCLTYVSAFPTIVGQCSGSGYAYGDTGSSGCGTIVCNQTLSSGWQCVGSINPGSGIQYASDGTPCGTSNQCYNNACVPSSSLPSGATTSSSSSSSTGTTTSSTSSVTTSTTSSSSSSTSSSNTGGEGTDTGSDSSDAATKYHGVTFVASMITIIMAAIVM